MPSEQLSFVLLAGERPGGSALAQAAGVAAGVLVDVAGQTAIGRVFATLRAHPRLRGGLLCGPAEAVVQGSAELRALLAGDDVRWLAPGDGPGASALRALDALGSYPALLTTGDHALLHRDILDQFLDRALAHAADIVVGLVPYATVQAAFPESRRTVLRFADGGYCGSNLFLVRTPEGRRAIEFWRRVEALRKRPWKIASQLGVFTLLRYLSGRLRLDQALAVLGGKAGCRAGWVPLDSARAAVDVDSIADLELASRLLRDDRSPVGSADRA